MPQIRRQRIAADHDPLAISRHAPPCDRGRGDAGHVLGGPRTRPHGVGTQPVAALCGLENGAAGEVVAALEQRGVAHEVRGTSIFVDSTQRDALRMTLAGEGLPTSSSRGYEILDGLSGFGTTSQMFDAAYWRAKEGELARTIVAHPAISSARVHLASTGSNPFQRDIRQSASVSITAQSGGITPKHARALRFLVA